MKVQISNLRSATKDPLETSLRQKILCSKKMKKTEIEQDNCKKSGDKSNDWPLCVDIDSKIAFLII